MTKEKALSIIKEIQSGEWDRNTPDCPKGLIAIDKWEDPLFSYGMEYGAIVGLMQVFDLTIEDINNFSRKNETP